MTQTSLPTFKRAWLVMVCAFALASSCATVPFSMPKEQQARSARKFAGETLYLKLSFFVTPFFADETKRLLTAVPPEQVRLLESPDGQPILPGKAERIFSAGTPVRVRRVEFPSGLGMTERVLYTPRTQPWVFLEVDGAAKNAPPFILVLRQGLRNEAEFDAEIERYLSSEDPRPALNNMAFNFRDAVFRKQVMQGMPTDAVEMAWGYPEKKVVTFESGARKEKWIWPDQRRQLIIIDQKVRDVFDVAAAGQNQTP